MTTNKASRKDKKRRSVAKPRKSVAKLRRSVAKLRRSRRNKINNKNISDLYTYESAVTNKSESTNSNFNVQNNVNVVHGLKDFLAVKK
jgi:hypothetical protein